MLSADRKELLSTLRDTDPQNRDEAKCPEHVLCQMGVFAWCNDEIYVNSIRTSYTWEGTQT